MIRYPNPSDAEWIYNLIRDSELSYIQVTIEDINDWITNRCIIVEDKHKSFLKWTEEEDCINIDFTVTQKEERGNGGAMILASYIWCTSNLPIKFSVPKDSPQEYYTVFSSKYKKNRCELINECFDGKRVWRTYIDRNN